MKHLYFAFLLALGCAAQAQAPAPVTVEHAWARTSVQGQSGTGAFMTLTAREPLTLVGVSTPAAGVAEIHEMKMEGDVMKMRPIEALPLPAGKAVELKPGGHHLMLMNLKAPLQAGTQVPVTLRLRDAKGNTRTLDVSVPVSARAPANAPAGHKH
jgi:copper(I)-binding protein